MEIMQLIADMLIIVFGGVIGAVVLGAAAFYWYVIRSYWEYRKEN